MKKNIIKATLSVAFVGILFATFITYEVYFYLNSPITDLQDPPNKLVTIPKGAHFIDVIKILSEKKLLDFPSRFRWLANYHDAFSKIKAGEYIIQAKWTPNQVLDYLIAGKSEMYRVTVPEGLTFDEITNRLANMGLGKFDEFRKLKENLELRKLVNITPTMPSLEGALFPETYFFSKTESEFDILSVMINQFNKNFTKSFRERIKELGLTEYEVLTLASIIEKETGRSEDRNLISAVFHNRLKKRMRLESDPTVIYGIKKFDGNITRKHLQTKTPYNTYTNYGLPLSPISNPGKEAIESTLYPESVNYLYFVAKGDGTSQFSSTLRAHNQAVQHYQKNRNHRLKVSKK